jgi:hypothetical protein
MGNDQGLIRVTSPLVPDQEAEAFAAGLNAKPAQFLRLFRPSDFSPLDALPQSTVEGPRGLAASFAGSYYMVTPQRGAFIALGRVQSEPGEVGGFWHSNPCARRLDLSRRLGSALLARKYGNTGAHATWILVPHGIRLFRGASAPQTDGEGRWAPGGDVQYFIPPPVAQALHAATLALLAGQKVDIDLAKIDRKGYDAECAKARKLQAQYWRAYHARGKELGVDTAPGRAQRLKEFAEVEADEKRAARGRARARGRAESSGPKPRARGPRLGRGPRHRPHLRPLREAEIGPSRAAHLAPACFCGNQRRPDGPDRPFLNRRLRPSLRYGPGLPIPPPGRARAAGAGLRRRPRRGPRIVL